MVGQIAKEYDASKTPLENAANLQRTLFDYSMTLQDWALEVSAMMIARVANDDLQTWYSYFKDTNRVLSKTTREVLKSQSVGSIFYDLQKRQVDLITSLARDAAEDVHKATAEMLSSGARPESIVKRIREELPEHWKHRATLIARTETARARSNFTEARARALGSTHYVWRTVGDARVRPSHARLNRTVQSWDNPPECDFDEKRGIVYRAHPGTIWNCRCIADPLLPEDEE